MTPRQWVAIMAAVWGGGGLVEPHLPNAGQPLNEVAIVQNLILAILLFGWCKAHAQAQSIKPPTAAPLLVALIAPVGVPYYALRGFGFRRGALLIGWALLTFAGFLALYIVCFAVSARIAPTSHAQAAIDATDEAIVHVLAPELRDARLLTMRDLTDREAEKVSTTPDVGRRFVGDFDKDGQQDLALFGSYMSGETSGTFVLVASRRESGWHRSGLLRFPQPFIIGLGHADVLNVLFCVGCDQGGRIVSTPSGYEYMPFPEPGVPE